MTLEYNQSTTSEIRVISEGSCEQAVDCEISLPDYCPDILRVLKCTVSPCVVSSKITGDRAGADGNAVIRMIYCDEDDNICSAEQSIPFSKYIETGAESEGSLSVSAKAEYINCRAVSRRKAEVHCTLKFVFTVCTVSSEKFISGIETENIQTKGGSLDYCVCSACECKLFPVSETAELPRDYLPAQRIINACAVPILSEAKIIKGKLLLKGEISVGIIYCAEKNKGECTKFDYSIPLNQVVDAAGTDEDGFADVCLKTSSCDIASREDSDGEQRFFDINLVVSAKISAFAKMKSDYISDAYSTNSGLDADYKEISFPEHTGNINQSFSSSHNYDFSSVSAQKILAVWFGTPEIKTEDGSSEIKGKAPLSFILADSENKPVFCEREFEFEYKAKGDGEFINVPCVALSGFTVSSLNSGATELKAEFAVNGSTFSKRTERVMISAKQSEKDENKKSSGVVIYFPDENEKLWDIARRYGTTEQAIRKENDLNGDSFGKDTPLVIPCS